MSAFSPQPVINALLDKHLGTAFAEFGVAIVEQLADRYGFDATSAVCELGLDTISVARSTAADAKPASARRLVPAFPLPYCGEHNPDWCRAIKANHGLYTQCTMPHGPGSDLCKTCSKACEANGGTCVYGRIEDRGQDGWQAPSGAVPTHYSKIMKKLNIDAALVAPEAAKFGWELPAGCTEPVPAPAKAKTKAKKPEPVSPIVGSEEDTPPAPQKKGGRPARTQKPVTATGAGDDLIAQLIAEAREERPAGSPVSDQVAEEQALRAAQREQAEIERTASLVRQDAQKANDKRSKQEEKEAKARAKQEEKEAKARAKQEEKEAKARRPSRRKRRRRPSAKQEEKEEKEAKARAKREEKEAKAKRQAGGKGGQGEGPAGAQRRSLRPSPNSGTGSGTGLSSPLPGLLPKTLPTSRWSSSASRSPMTAVPSPRLRSPPSAGKGSSTCGMRRTGFTTPSRKSKSGLGTSRARASVPSEPRSIDR